MSIQKRLRHIAEILEELEISDAEIESDSRHIKVNITGPLGTRRVTASTSPSDRRATLNFRSDCRRIAQQVGALPA